jgi:hypothetical protein
MPVSFWSLAGVPAPAVTATDAATPMMFPAPLPAGVPMPPAAVTTAATPARR